MKDWDESSMRAKGLNFRITGGAPVDAAPVAEPKRGNKYNAQKTIVDGITFDSGAEAERYKSLKLLERAKVIRGLGCQPVFALIGGNGRPVASYRADFAYFESGRCIVEDVKSLATLTPASKLKIKLFLAQHPSHELRLVDGNGKPVPYKPRFPKEQAA